MPDLPTRGDAPRHRTIPGRRPPARLPLALLALAAIAAPGAAQVLVDEPFDSGIAWTLTKPSQVTSQFFANIDAGASCSSGAALLSDSVGTEPGSSHGLDRCVPVTGGATLDGRVLVQDFSTRGATGSPSFVILYYTDAACTSYLTGAEFADDDTLPLDGRWHLLDGEVTVPAGARSAEIFLGILRSDATGTYRVAFDEVQVCANGECNAGLGPAFTTPEFPGFRFRVRIGALDAVVEPPAGCLPDTVCLSGALPGRTEVLLRIIGPRPNGHLWFQAVRFTPSVVVLEVEQLATGVIRHYLLKSSLPGERPLGIEDRTAFLP